MLHHLVWWTFKEEALGATAEKNAHLLKEKLEMLGGKIPSLLSIELSLKILSTSTQQAQLILHTSHADEKGLQEYAEHPLHLDCLPFVKAVTASRNGLDFIV